MSTIQQFTDFLEFIETNFKNRVLAKVVLSKKSHKSNELQKINIKQIQIKNEFVLNFTLHYSTKDISKNYNLEESLLEFKNHLPENFLEAYIETTQETAVLKFNKKRIPFFTSKKNNNFKTIDFQHNKTKRRFIDTKNKPYLVQLGITNKSYEIIPSMSDKFRQINKFIEILSHYLEKIQTTDTIQIVDMGSGKGYLTFALYDYISNILQKKVIITGVETQQHLVDFCNTLAKNSDFENLKFEKSNINEYKYNKIDVLISLHACDTATDDTLYAGIVNRAKLIVSSPCCHKQVRKQMQTPLPVQHITKFGILKERQAEILTDTIRALLLEKEGYKTKITEFVSLEFTGKNLLIIGEKQKSIVNKTEIGAQIDELKKLFGIEYHYLEKLLQSSTSKDQSWRNLNPVCHIH